MLPALPSGLDPLIDDDPETLDEFRLLGRLGQGGFGTVYLGEADGRWVAIKALRTDKLEMENRVRGLHSEARALGMAPPDTCAALLDDRLDRPRPYLVLQYLGGPTLRSQVDDRGPMSGADLVTMSRDLMATIVALHQAQIVHRDVKPRNVILGDRLRLIDFGNADSGPDVWQAPSGALFGSTKWMAQEQVMGLPVGTWTDVHAWGLCTLFAATGEPPFQAQSVPAMVLRVITLEPEIPDTMPNWLAKVVRASLTKDPQARPTAADVLQAFEGA